jgi:XTP/dITP diphosphohydrolase
MEIMIATKNQGKLAEFRRMLEPLGFSVISQMEAGIEGQAEENGSTFEENAMLKARYLYEKTNIATIADDSGLCVDALDGAPGVYSARYAGDHASDADRNALLLYHMKDIPEEKRTAKFVCAIAAILPQQEFCVVGECYGKIGYAPKGEGGFGYDPLFLVGDRSFSELSAEEKDAISHRGIALKKLVQELKKMREQQ